jgi:hypothetical protein
MDPAESPTVLTEEGAFKIVSYLVASAELAIIEPDLYGPLRLIDAASRLIEEMSGNVDGEAGAFDSALKADIDANKESMMWDKEAFVAFIRRMPAHVATEVKRRRAEGGPGAGA